MRIVADTSPLNYLLLSGSVQVLPRLYGRVFIPPQVREELLDPHTPEAVRSWAEHVPPWIVVRSPKSIEHSLGLDQGEAAAIALAQEMGADRLLIDDREGRQVAADLGLSVAGTLAVLRDAAIAGHLNLRTTFEHLRKTIFRASPQLLEQVLRDFEKADKG